MNSIEIYTIHQVFVEDEIVRKIPDAPNFWVVTSTFVQ